MSRATMYSAAVETKLTRIEKEMDKREEKIGQLQRQNRDAEKEMHRIKIGDCPIKAGDKIVWESGSGKNVRKYRGEVISISISRRFREAEGYVYRVARLNKKGTPIGFATITDEHGPVLEGKE